MQRIPVTIHMHAIVSTITYAYPVLKNPIGFRHIKNLILLLLLVLRVFEIFVLLFLKYHVLGNIWSQLNMQPLGGAYVDMSGWMEF